MNKYQESLNFIVENSCPHHTTCDKCNFKYFCNSEARIHIDRLQELIDRNTPKEPIGDLNSVPHYRCPNCYCTVKLYNDGPKEKFCRYCGQVIDWSDCEG